MSRMGTATGQLMNINSVTAQSGADEFDMLAQSRTEPIKAAGYVRAKTFSIIHFRKCCSFLDSRMVKKLEPLMSILLLRMW